MDKMSSERIEFILQWIQSIVVHRIAKNCIDEPIGIVIRSQGPFWELRNQLCSIIKKALGRPVKYYDLPVVGGRTQSFGNTFQDTWEMNVTSDFDRFNNIDLIFIDDGFITCRTVRYVTWKATTYRAKKLCIIGAISRLTYSDEISFRCISCLREPDELKHEGIQNSETQTKVTFDCLWHLRTPVYRSYADSPLYDLAFSYFSTLEFPLTVWAKEFAHQNHERFLAARNDFNALSEEFDDKLENLGTFKWHQKTLREELQLFSEDLVPALTKVTNSLERSNPDIDDAIIALFAYEPDLVELARGLAGQGNYRQLTNICLAVLRDSKRSHGFHLKALRVLWFQQRGYKGPYVDSISEIFDSVLQDTKIAQAAFFYFASSLARYPDENKYKTTNIVEALKNEESRLRSDTIKYESARVDLCCNLHALRQMYEMKAKDPIVENSFEGFKGICSLFLHTSEIHPTSIDSAGASFGGTWCHLDDLLNELRSLDEIDDNIETKHLFEHWSVLYSTFIDSILPRLSFVKNRFERTIKMPSIPIKDILNEDVLLLLVGTILGILNNLKSDWFKWSEEERRKKLDTLIVNLEKLQKIAFDGPSRRDSPGSQLASLLESHQTQLGEALNRSFRRAEKKLHDCRNCVLQIQQLCENAVEVNQCEDLKACVLGHYSAVRAILDNMLDNIVDHAVSYHNQVLCKIIVTVQAFSGLR